jgi:biotin operon repressor
MGNLRGEAMVLANAASARHTLLGDDDRAHADALRASRHFVEIGDRAREAQCLEIMAGVAGRQGRNEEASRLLEDSLQGMSGTGNKVLEGQHLRSLALLHLDQGEHLAAAATLDRADRVCLEAGLHDLAVELLSIRGAVLLAMGEEAGALAASRDAVDRLSPGVERQYLIHHRHAVVATAVGSHEEARRSALKAHSLLDIALAGLTDDERDGAIRRVPEHREIVTAAARLSPQQIQVLLPAVGTPTGRPLGKDDLRRVNWTIDHPEDDRVASPIDRRRMRLLRLLNEADDEAATPSIDHLARALGVSESTVRRDLAGLRLAGHPVSTRGQRQRVS